jgi:hypothetical protein
VEQETMVVLQARLPAMTPDLTADGVERRYPADLYGVLPSGEPLLIVPLQKPLLLCFRVDEATWSLHEQGAAELTVQRYDDILTPQIWIDLPVVPGWTDRQVCAVTDHLSLFALGVRHGDLAAPLLVLQTPAGTPAPVDGYGIPTPAP